MPYITDEDIDFNKKDKTNEVLSKSYSWQAIAKKDNKEKKQNIVFTGKNLTGGNFDQIYGATNIIANACDRTVVRCKDVLTGEVSYPKNTLNAMVRYVINNL